MTEARSSPTRLPPSSLLPRRILAIWLPRLAIDRWRLGEGIGEGEGEDAAPLALIAETAHGPRIAAANAAGRAAGARAGMMLADARALCPPLAVAPFDPRYLEQRIEVACRLWHRVDDRTRATAAEQIRMFAGRDLDRLAAIAKRTFGLLPVRESLAPAADQPGMRWSR